MTKPLEKVKHHRALGLLGLVPSGGSVEDGPGCPNRWEC